MRTQKRTSVAPTLRDYAADVLDRMRSGTIRRPNGDTYRDTTTDGYDASLRLHAAPLHRARLDAITHRDVQNLAGALAAEFSGATVKNTITALNVVYRQARREGVVTANPTAGVTAPSRGRRTDVAISPELIPAYLDALEPRERAVWAVMFYGGLRLGEALGLRWSDIGADEIRVCQQRAADGVIVRVKTRAGNRTVPVIATLATELDAAPGDHAFLAGDASRETFRRRSAAAFVRAGLDPIIPHAARHTFASLMIAAGVDAKVLSSVVGHESIATTMDVYGHLFPRSFDAMRSAVEGFLSMEKTNA